MIGLRLFLVRHGGVLRRQYLLNRQKSVNFAAEAIVFIIALEELRLHLRSLAYDFRQYQILLLLLLLHQELLRDCNDLLLTIPAPSIRIYHHLLLLENLWTTVCITSKEVILSDW